MSGVIFCTLVDCECCVEILWVGGWKVCGVIVKFRDSLHLGFKNKTRINFWLI